MAGVVGKIRDLARVTSAATYLVPVEPRLLSAIWDANKHLANAPLDPATLSSLTCPSLKFMLMAGAVRRSEDVVMLACAATKTQRDAAHH
jgi:hypothetical protein